MANLNWKVVNDRERFYFSLYCFDVIYHPPFFLFCVDLSFVPCGFRWIFVGFYMFQRCNTKETTKARTMRGMNWKYYINIFSLEWSNGCISKESCRAFHKLYIESKIIKIEVLSEKLWPKRNDRKDKRCDRMIQHSVEFLLCILYSKCDLMR